MKFRLLFVCVFVVALFTGLYCSNNDERSDSGVVGDTSISDLSSIDTLSGDIFEDTGIKPEKYFAISFKNRNEILFFDRENLSEISFHSIPSKGEISSIEFIKDINMLVYADLGGKELVFVKDFKEIKKIGNVGDYPYSIKYIPKLKLLISPDKSSNRIYIIDTEKLEFLSISPMSAGGNSPVSICFDESPLTRELLVRLFILDYSSLYVRAYDIFDTEDWGLRGEKLPSLSEPMHIACDSTNRRLLISNSASNNISAYGLDDLVQIANSPFEAGKNPTFAAMYTGASIAYVLNTSEDSLTIFSTKEMKTKGGLSFKTGDAPERAYVNEDEGRLYILLGGGKSLLVYDISDPLMPEKIQEIKFDSTPGDLIYR